MVQAPRLKLEEGDYMYKQARPGFQLHKKFATHWLGDNPFPLDKWTAFHWHSDKPAQNGSNDDVWIH
jgi:hypothetical protein